MGFLTLFCVFYIQILYNNYLFTWLYYFAICINAFLPDFFFRGIEKMKNITIPFTLAKAITVILTLLFIKSDSDLLMIPMFEIAGNSIAVLVSFYLIKQLHIVISIGSLKEWLIDLKDSGIYFLSNFAISIFGSFTTLLVGFFLNLTEV